MEHVASNNKQLVKVIKQQNQKNNAADVLIPVMTVESNVMCLENNIDEKHPQIQARKFNKKFKSLDLHYIKPQQQQATNIRNSQEINYVHVSSEMLSSAGSSNDISGNTGNSSKTSVNSNDNYDSQPQKQHSYLKSVSQNNFHGKLVRNVERKSSVPDAGSLTYKDRTQLKKPKKDVRRAEIVAAVTKRLYTTKKKVDAKPEAEPQPEQKVSNDQEPEELKLCSRARFKLQEISKRALNVHRKMKHLIIDVETQTDFIPTLRVKEIGLNTDISGGIHTSEVSVNTNMFEFPIHLLLCENKLIHHNACNQMPRVNNQFDNTINNKNSKTVIFKEVSVATDNNYTNDTSNTDFTNSDISKLNSVCKKESYNNFTGKSCLCMKYGDDHILKGNHEQYLQLSLCEPARRNFSVQTNISSDRDTTVGGLSKDQLKCCCFSEKFACDNNEIKSQNVIDFGISKCAKNLVPGSNKTDKGVGTSNNSIEMYGVDNLNTKEVQTYINQDHISIKEAKLKPEVAQKKAQTKTYNVRNSIGTLTDLYYPSNTLWNWKKCINYSSGEFMNMDGAKTFKFKAPDTYVQNISEENISDDSLDIYSNFKLTNEQYKKTLENKLSEHCKKTNFQSSPENKHDNCDTDYTRPLTTIFSKNNKNPERNQVLTEPHNYSLSSKIIGNAESLINTRSNIMRLPPLGLELWNKEGNDKIFSEKTNIASTFHSNDTIVSENHEQIKFKQQAKHTSNEINSDKSEHAESKGNKIFSRQNHSEANNIHLSSIKCHCSDQQEKVNTLKTDSSIKDVLRRLFPSNSDVFCNGLLRNQSAQTEKVCLSGNYHKMDFNCNATTKGARNALEKGEASENCYIAGSFELDDNECTHFDAKVNACVCNDQYIKDKCPKHHDRNGQPKFYLNQGPHVKYFSNNLTLPSSFSHQSEDMNQESKLHSIRTGFACKNCPQVEENQQSDYFGCFKSKSLDYNVPLKNSCAQGRMGSFKMNKKQILSPNGKEDEKNLNEQSLKQLIPEVSLKQNDLKTEDQLPNTLSKTEKNSIADDHKLSSPITLISENMTFFISKPLTQTNGTICSKHVKQKIDVACPECLELQNVEPLSRNLSQDMDTERSFSKKKAFVSQDAKSNCLETNIPSAQTESFDRNESLEYHSQSEVNGRISHTLMTENIPSSEVQKGYKENSEIKEPHSSYTKINPCIITLTKKETQPMEEASCSNNNMQKFHWNKSKAVDETYKQHTDINQSNQMMNGNTACAKPINQLPSNIRMDKNTTNKDHSNENSTSVKKKIPRKKKKNCHTPSPSSIMDPFNINNPITQGWGNAGAVGTWFTLSTFVKKANTLLKSLGEVSEMMEKVKNNQTPSFNEPHTTDTNTSFKASVKPINECNVSTVVPPNTEHLKYQTRSIAAKYYEQSVPISKEPYLHNYVSQYDDSELYQNIKFNELPNYLYTKENNTHESLKPLSVEPDLYGNHHSIGRKSLPCFTKTHKSDSLDTQDLTAPQQIQKELPLLNFSASPSSTSSIPYQSSIQYTLHTFPQNDSLSKEQAKRYLQESYSLPDFNQATEQRVIKKEHCCFGNVFNNIVNYQRHKKKQIHIACVYTTDASVGNFGNNNESSDLTSIPRCIEMAKSSPRVYKQYLLDLRRQIASDSGYCQK